MSASNESSVYSAADILRITVPSINLGVGVPINSWVLWLILSGPAGTVASDFFTLNLSVSDILSCLLCFPSAIKPIKLLEYFAFSLQFNGRSIFQCCICVERFLAVVHPVLFLKYKPLRYRAACSGVAWLVTVGFALLYTLVFNQKALYWTFLSQCLFFMSGMLSCSLAVLRALKRPAPGESSGRERERDNGMKRRAFAIICLNMGTFLGCNLAWSTFDILCILGGDLVEFTELAMHMCAFIYTVVAFVQPLLYLWQRAGKLLPCC